jgi:ATP-binding cassette subfamily C (CFTR/MRP) protein 1
MACVIMPLTIVVMVVLIIIIVTLAIGFIKTSTELRRLSQNSLSPIISTISEMINGLTSIRVFGKTEFIGANFTERVMLNDRVYLHEGYVQSWMTVWLDVSMAVLIGFVSLFVVLTRYVSLTSNESGNVYGFVLSSTISMGGFLPMMLFTLTESLKSVSSIQRLHEYFTNKNIERPYEVPAAPKDWPTDGTINIENLTVRYREGLPLVLKGISFNIGRYEKVGVVGRTGSGKSTMILALTRIIEMDGPEGNPVGHVSIDGVRIDRIGLHELRKLVTIIPQDPLMLAGTLRFNVDSMGQYNDEDIIFA